MQTYLGKPTAPPHIAHLCHHKDLFRKAQRQLGYLTPRTPSDNPDLPLWIIKPTDGSGSRGTTILTNIQRCFEKARYTAATDRAKSVSSDGGVVVEECLKGTEHTVETLFDAYGIFHPCFITDRMFTYMGGYPVETGLRHPSTLPDYLQRKAYQIAENMGRDLGVDRGPFKLDIMVTDGGVYVLEATTRFSGGWDSQLLVPAATGKEVLKAGILTCMGRDGIAPLLRPKWNKVGVSVSIWPNPGVITSITGVSDATLSHPGVVDVILRKGVGDTVTPYTDCTKRVGWVFAVAENEESAWRIVNEAASLIHVETV
jgi:biotin carboxylase